MLRDRAARSRPLEEARPVFPAPLGGWRDPSYTQADLRDAFAAAGFDWVTSHVFRKTVRWDQADLAVEASVIEPVDVLGDGDLEVVDALPRALVPHRLGS